MVADTLTRIAPVLVFLVGVTVLAELSDAAGVFDAVARRGARLARGRTWLLFLLVVVIATTTTVFLSLDTTAVLLTPVVLSLCGQLGLAPLPFALATVWLANTASLLLPVSNLTNLLAVDRLALTPAHFAGRMWAPALVAVLVTTAVLLLLYRRQLRGRYSRAVSPAVADRLLFLGCTACVGLFAVLVLAGLNVSVAATTCAGLAGLLFARRRPDALRWSLIPWRLVLLVMGLFLLIETAHQHGLGDLVANAAGSGTGLPDLLRLAGTAAGGANVTNNLPAYLAFEPVAEASPDRLLAVLIGVNLGPLVTPWGSLATLLWLERCRARGVAISLRTFALAGLLLTPLVIIAATATLALG